MQFAIMLGKGIVSHNMPLLLLSWSPFPIDSDDEKDVLELVCLFLSATCAYVGLRHRHPGPSLSVPTARSIHSSECHIQVCTLRARRSILPFNIFLSII